MKCAGNKEVTIMPKRLFHQAMARNRITLNVSLRRTKTCDTHTERHPDGMEDGEYVANTLDLLHMNGTTQNIEPKTNKNKLK